MKYSIHGFSQPRAVELGLSNDDLLVLRWFVDFCGTGKMQSVVESDGIYYWVNYQSVLDDLPVLRISKDRLYRKHFKALCNAQVLCHKHIKGGGSFSYYGYAVNYETLVYFRDKPPTVNLPEGTAEIPEGTAEIPHPSGENAAPSTAELPHPSGENAATNINLLNQSIIDHSTKESERQSDSDEEPVMVERFNEFWAAYPKKVGKKAAFKSWKRENPDANLHTKIMEAVAVATDTWQWKEEYGRFIPNPATWLNQGRWDDEYEEGIQGGDDTKHFERSSQPGKEQNSKPRQDPLAGFKQA